MRSSGVYKYTCVRRLRLLGDIVESTAAHQDKKKKQKSK